MITSLSLSVFSSHKKKRKTIQQIFHVNNMKKKTELFILMVDFSVHGTEE